VKHSSGFYEFAGDFDYASFGTHSFTRNLFNSHVIGRESARQELYT